MAIDRCTQILVERGRFRQAADRKKNMGELYREDPNRLDLALASYDQAATWYLQEGATAYVVSRPILTQHGVGVPARGGADRDPAADVPARDRAVRGRRDREGR